MGFQNPPVPGSSPPSGAAGGSLAGTYPNPTIASSVSLPGNPTTSTPAPGDNSAKVATTAFVSLALAGINPAVAVQAATTTAGNTSGLTYLNGAAGVGATFTGVANTALTVDGFTFTTVGQRLLVKNDTQSPSGAFNGIYFVTQIQTALVPIILTRALDYDQPSDINNTGAIPVVNGAVNGSTSWLLTSAVSTVGTDPLTYTQFSLNPSTLVTTASAAPFLAGKLIGADMNAAGDQQIALAFPTGTTRYRFDSITWLNPSVSLTTAVASIYTRASKGGLVISTVNAGTLTASGPDATGSLVNPAGVASYFTAVLDPIFYLNLTTLQGAPATCDIYVWLRALP